MRQVGPVTPDTPSLYPSAPSNAGDGGGQPDKRVDGWASSPAKGSQRPSRTKLAFNLERNRAGDAGFPWSKTNTPPSAAPEALAPPAQQNRPPVQPETRPPSAPQESPPRPAAWSVLGRFAARFIPVAGQIATAAELIAWADKQAPAFISVQEFSPGLRLYLRTRPDQSGKRAYFAIGPDGSEAILPTRVEPGNLWKGLLPGTQFIGMVSYNPDELNKDLKASGFDIRALPPQARLQLGIADAPAPAAGGEDDDRPYIIPGSGLPPTPEAAATAAQGGDAAAVRRAVENQEGKPGPGPAGGIAGNEGRRPAEPLAQSPPRSTGGTTGAAFQTAKKSRPKPYYPTWRRIEDPGVSGVLLSKAEADFMAKNIIKYARYFRRELILVKEGEDQYRLKSGYVTGQSGQLNPPGLVIRAYKNEGTEDVWETYDPGRPLLWW